MVGRFFNLGQYARIAFKTVGFLILVADSYANSSARLLSEAEVGRLTKNMKANYSSWTLEKKMVFHYHFIRSLGASDKAGVEEPVSTSNLLNFSVAPVVAKKRPAPCLFGGYPSHLDRRGKCLPAWKAREASYQRCGKRKGFRCNPIVFSHEGIKRCPSIKGAQKNTPKNGCCIRIDGSEGSSSDVIASCLKWAYGKKGHKSDSQRIAEGMGIDDFAGQTRGHQKRRRERIIRYAKGKVPLDMEKLRNHVERLAGDKKKLAEYVNLVAIELDSCNDVAGSCSAEPCKKMINLIDQDYYPVFVKTHCMAGTTIFPRDPYGEMAGWLSESYKAQKIIEEQHRINRLLESEFGGDFWSGDCMPVALLQGKRRMMKRQGRKGCLSDRVGFENVMLKESSWGELDTDARIEKVYQTAKEVYKEMKRSAGHKWRSKSSLNSRDRQNNSHAFYSFVNPESMSCIAYQEVRDANPLRYNYTFCRRGRVSTAHGLTMVTARTFKHFFNQESVFPRKDGLTKNGQVIEDLRISAIEAHRAMSLSPHYQMEVGMRILNGKAKEIRGGGKKPTLKRAIVKYDRDQRSKYVPAVMRCYQCMKKVRKNGGKAKACYDKM